MNELKIQTFLTKDVPESIWKSYIENFNFVFNKSFDLDHFINKYDSYSNNSYHSFLIARNKVVAATSIVPMKYWINKKKIIVGLVVDLFVVKEHRKDPLIILKLYSELKKIIKNEISIVIAVPNINSVRYFLNILKFKQVGNLNYKIFPVNIGNISFNGNKLINKFSQLFSEIHFFINKINSIFLVSEDKPKIYLDLNNKFLKNRFNGPYENYCKENYRFNYRIEIENGTKTAYLIYFDFNGKPNFKALLYAVKFIKNKEDIDLILYVGSLTFCQTLMLKVPKFLEPKALPFIYENINLSLSQLDIVDNFKNWDFSLINYDVR